MRQNLIKQEKITSCRLCNSDKIKKVITLEKMPFTDEFVTQSNIGKEFLSDIEIGICIECGSIQNLNNTDMTDYYFDYTYSVKSSNFAINFMHTLAQRVKNSYFNHIPNPKILEIGSGSGEQLFEFKKLGFYILGIEPSDKLSKYARTNGINTITTLFDEHTKSIIDDKFGFADAVLLSYTFDHIPKVNEVLRNIYNILKTGGLLILEIHDFDLICLRKEFCLFEHEHYTYLNKKTVEQLLNKNQFEVLTFDLLSNNEKRGNSLLVVAKTSRNVITKLFDVQNEINKILNLKTDISNAIDRIDNWLMKYKDKKIVAYGAGGRGIITIAALKHPEYFTFIVDKNPKETNLFSPKSHLPVYSIDKLSDQEIDKILVFSYGYYDEIVNEISGKFGYKPDQFISILDLLVSNNE